MQPINSQHYTPNTTKKISNSPFKREIDTKSYVDFATFSKKLESTTAQLEEKNMLIEQRNKRLELKSNKHLKKHLKEAIEILVSQGEAVPARLINALNKLK